MNKCDATTHYKKDDIVAVKVHFGEMGNTAFIRPIFLRPILEVLNRNECKPFLTDTNTLYVGMRTNSVDHIHNANLNGFNYSTLQTPVIIADGMRGENSVAIPFDGELISSAKLAADIVHADALFVVSHYKGHEVSGFGGAIKNLSMGCASREGKLEMHSTSRPSVHQDKCDSCGKCVQHCAAGAIILNPRAEITDICTGCSRCIAVCPKGAIGVNWNESSDNTQKKMVEYAAAVAKHFNRPIVYINFLTTISPACDCYPGNDAPVTSDIGYLASTDPVAIDKASYDLVKQAVGEDPFKKLYHYLDPEVQFAHAEKIGFGNTEYTLKAID